MSGDEFEIGGDDLSSAPSVVDAGDVYGGPSTTVDVLDDDNGADDHSTADSTADSIADSADDPDDDHSTYGAPADPDGTELDDIPEQRGSGALSAVGSDDPDPGEQRGGSGTATVDAGGSGLPPGGAATGGITGSPLWKDPAQTQLALSSPTMIGHPVTDQSYLQYQGTGNAFCGPYSAAMVLNSLNGGKGPTGQEMVDAAVAAGTLTQDPTQTGNSWGGWSGMYATDLDKLLDDQLAPNGSSELTDGNDMQDLADRLANQERVVVFVDSGELMDQNPDADELPGTQGNPNHFLVVTAVDLVNGWVMMNDPYKQQPSMMPLDQFYGAWRDSDCTMLDVDTGPPAPAVAPPGTSPLVPLPGPVTGAPTPTVPAGPAVLPPVATGLPPAPVPAPTGMPGPAAPPAVAASTGGPLVPGLPAHGVGSSPGVGTAPSGTWSGSVADARGGDTEGSGWRSSGSGAGSGPVFDGLGAVPLVGSAGAEGSASVDWDGWDLFTIIPMTLEILAAAPMAIIDGVIRQDPATVALAAVETTR